MSETKRPKAKEKMVDVTFGLGDLKPLVEKTAKRWGVSPEEFVRDAIEYQVRQRVEDYEEHSFTPHGGKHRSGKYTGYEVTKDGKYYPAPSWTGQFDEMFAERSAITNLVNQIVRTAQERLIEVEKSIHKAKERLIDDLKLDPSKNWVYYGTPLGYLQEHKEPETDGAES